VCLPFYQAPEHLITVDPGTTKCGLAYFYRGALRGAITLQQPTVADAQAWVQGVVPAGAQVVWVREHMDYYPGATATYPNLDKVEDWADALAVALDFKWARTWAARSWKGNIPKPVHHSRLRKVLDSTEERWIWDHSQTGEDGRDAVGIGLFALRRVICAGVAPT
jgi:hypothetical protein